ncbi:cytoplasmic,Malate dehydrogenase [Trichinella spiralis]|uniref:Cytoplasmic,Malate dehydrogenase n=1 Tax=Trichinella spiralis TaxID=6334 RepID=A0ABR3KRJ8_TRISP
MSCSIDYLISGLAETVETEFSFIVSYRALVTGNCACMTALLRLKNIAIDMFPCSRLRPTLSSVRFAMGFDFTREKINNLIVSIDVVLQFQSTFCFTIKAMD